ncbi:hypothetical protein HKD37_17G048480 [Glycine soja]
MVGYAPSSFADLVFTGERIKVGMERGKYDHPALMNVKTGANEEDENEGETHAVTAIPIQPSFPPTQQSITLARFPQPPFFRGYGLNATCAYHGGALGHSIEHFMTLKHKGGPLGTSTLTFRGLQALIFRGLHVLAIRGLHALTIRGLHALTFRGLHVVAFRGLRVLIFSVLHIHTLREFKESHPQRHPVDQQGPGVSSFGYGPLLVLQGARSPQQGIVPTKTPSGPGEVQQGPGVSSSGYRPLLVLQGIAPARHPVDPKKFNRVLELLTLITGLCQFYGAPVAPNKVIRPPINRAFIKKYYAPRQAQGETPQLPGDG